MTTVSVPQHRPATELYTRSGFLIEAIEQTTRQEVTEHA
jgi:hypothetical protein